MSNPLRYPAFMIQHPISAALATVEIESQKHDPTGCPGANCTTSTVRSTPSPAPTNAAASRSITNALRYPVLLIKYFISTTRADLTQTKLDTRGQDEEAEINDIAYGWRNRYQSSIPTPRPICDQGAVTFTTPVASSLSPEYDLKRHERKGSARDPLNCWIRDASGVEHSLCETCPLDARLRFLPFISTGSTCRSSSTTRDALAFLLQWPRFGFLAGRTKDQRSVKSITAEMIPSTTLSTSLLHAQAARNPAPQRMAILGYPSSAAPRSHSLPFRKALGLLPRCPNILLSSIHALTLRVHVNADPVRTPFTTPPPSLHFAAARKATSLGLIYFRSRAPRSLQPSWRRRRIVAGHLHRCLCWVITTRCAPWAAAIGGVGQCDGLGH